MVRSFDLTMSFKKVEFERSDIYRKYSHLGGGCQNLLISEIQPG